MSEHLLVTMSLRTFAIAGFSVLAGVLARTARPSLRSILWNSALFAALLTPFAWKLAPPLTVDVPARLFAATTPVYGTSSGVARPVSHSFSDATPLTVSTIRAFLTNGAAASAMLYLWLLGVAFFGVRFARQLRSARRLTRGATHVEHPQIDTILSDAQFTLGIRSDVATLQSSAIDIPFVSGITRPVILLPASASEWSNEELRIVLLHELAHVRRADILARAAAMTACTIHWFNPFVWLLGRLSARDAELAADALVIHAGVRPSTYADTLLNLAGRVFGFPDAHPAMPLAGRAGLADRVHAVLRTSDQHTDLVRFTRMTVIGGGTAAAILTACVRFAPTETTLSTPAVQVPAAKIASIAANSDTAWIETAADGLIRALGDASPQVRGGAAHSLGSLRSERARKPLRALLDDPDKYVRYEADRALAALDRTN